MKAVVTGGNGFIGTHVVDRLVALGWRVRVLDLFDRRFSPLPDGVEFIRGDMSNDYTLREAIADVDVVFHLAWGSIHEIATRDPLKDIEINVAPSVRLISHCHNAGVRRFVFLSSGGTVYGSAQYLPVDEEHPTDPINAYGITKLMVEKYLQMYHHLYGLDYVILRPSVPYGPGQDPRRRQGAVSVFLYRVARDEPIEIWGDGSVVRDYFYIDDLTSATVSAATAQVSKRVFNLGGGHGYSLKELVQAIEQVTGRSVDVEYQPARLIDVPFLLLDTSRAAECLGWTAEVELAEGMARTWDWILEAARTMEPLSAER